MAKRYVRENVPLSRFGVLVAQLESIVASASQQPPEALLCFDLLSDLISAIDEEPKESILLWQRKCEDALYSLLILGARRPIRHLASLAMARIISKGDGISIYSRASSLQGFLSDGRKMEPLRAAGAAQCLGELYQFFGKRITSGLLETTNIVAKLMKFHEEFVRQEALQMLQNALEGSGGTGAFTAYSEAFRVIMRIGVGDKSFVVRIAAARCLKTFASIGGPGLGVTELDNSASYCVKALEDPVSSVRDAFAEALGALLALGMNPDAQAQPRGKAHPTLASKLEGGLQRHLIIPFMKASGAHSKDLRIGLTLSWVFFLQAIRFTYLQPDIELQNFALQAMEMLHGDSSVDAHALACVLYILRVGVTDQMTEATQREFLVLLARQIESPDTSPTMEVSALRTLSYTLKSLGEVPVEFKEVLDSTVVAALSNSSLLVRIEAAIMLRILAEVDPTCVGGLISYGMTTLNALRENVSFEKGSNLKVELDSLSGQASVLAALVSISPNLPLSYPARLPKSVLELSRKMLTEPCRNPMAATVEKEAGWLLLASLISSMPKEELEDQLFDILSLWASMFNGSAENKVTQAEDLISEISVWSAAVDSLTAFIRCFVCSTVSTVNSGILLQPVLVYLTRALSYVALLSTKPQNLKPALDLFIIRILIAYQSLPDPMTYKSDHPQLIEICTTPFRDAFACEESSCLRLLLDKRDAWLGPCIPGRDWFEDELRAFQGGKDGVMPCVWESELTSFPQPETINKMLVNQMLLCFGVIFASQDSSGMLLLLGVIEQCLKAGKKQSWHAASITNSCVALLSGLKALVSFRPQILSLDVLSSLQSILQGILVEGDICASQRRASAEGLGLLARLGNDIFTARMMRSLLGDLIGATDPCYTGSVAVALGSIHRSAGGMALSTLVPATVSSISLLAKSSNAGLQVWSLHGLLLTIEAAGLSFVSHVQATLILAMDILLSEEIGRVDIRQGIGRLINAIVAVLGPELSPGSVFFSRCKSVIAEISSGQEISTLLESVRFTQQLVLFAPQAVSVHSHVQTLLPTLSSRQPTLRHLAVSTLHHLIETDPVSIIEEQIEDKLFRMLDDETDSEIGKLVRITITRLLYTSCPSCPSHWISLCRKMVIAASVGRNSKIITTPENDSLNVQDVDASLYHGEDDENMVVSSLDRKKPGLVFPASSVDPRRGMHVRYRTRMFAAECLSHLPEAVGKDPAHFDISLARKQTANKQAAGDWLVLNIQDLISLAYQISTIQFENMQPIGVELLSTIMDKFATIPDPELPGHLLLEQYQAQFVSAVRTALDTSAGPLLLDAGLLLATKILTSGITNRDQVAIKRVFSLISRPLDDFKDLYYPSFAEWVACKIKIRLLAAHASVKCYTYAFLRRQHSRVPNEYLALLPLLSKHSSVVGNYWIWLLKDYIRICFHLQLRDCKPFLDGIQSPLVSSKLQPCLEESWPVILQAISLDAVPVDLNVNGSSKTVVENTASSNLISGYQMVKLDSKEFQFLWGLALLVIFQGQQQITEQIMPIGPAKVKSSGDSPVEEKSFLGLKFYEIVLPVFQFLSMEGFFSVGFLTMDVCRELMQVFSYSIHMEDLWDSLVIPVLSQIVRNCPDHFLENEDFGSLAMELCVVYLYKVFQSFQTDSASQGHSSCQDLIYALFVIAETLVRRFEPKRQLKSILAFQLTCYKCLRGASTESCFSTVNDFVQSIGLVLQRHVDEAKLGDDGIAFLRIILVACQCAMASLATDCIESIHSLENKRSSSFKLLQMKLVLALEQTFSIAKLAYEIENLGDKKDRNIYFTIYNQCIKQIQTVLSDPRIQVQAIGLQVLRSIAQRATNVEDNTFFVFFAGELFREIFTIIQMMLKKPMSREDVAITSECLRLLFLLLSLSKATICQKALMNLLLEAIFIVFAASNVNNSQELIELGSTAVKLVSHIAQIPSSAVHFKDALLAMPVARRQQFQSIIRASVTPDQPATQINSTSSPLVIKLPMQTEGNTGKGTQVNASASATTHSDEEATEEDDWDAFQSFHPAASAADVTVTNISIPAEPAFVDNTSSSDSNVDYSNDFQECSSAQSTKDAKAINDAEDLVTFHAELLLATGSERNEIEEIHDPEPSNCAVDPSGEHHQEGEDEEETRKADVVTHQQKFLTAPGSRNDIEEHDHKSHNHAMEPSDEHHQEDESTTTGQENDPQMFSDHQSSENAERLGEENFTDESLQRTQKNEADGNELQVSLDLPLLMDAQDSGVEPHPDAGQTKTPTEDPNSNVVGLGNYSDPPTCGDLAGERHDQKNL